MHPDALEAGSQFIAIMTANMIGDHDIAGEILEEAGVSVGPAALVAALANICGWLICELAVATDQPKEDVLRPLAEYYAQETTTHG